MAVAGWSRRHPRLVDLGVVLAVFAGSVLVEPPPLPDPQGWNFSRPLVPAEVPLLAAGAAALLLRRSRPGAVWLVVAVLALADSLLLGGGTWRLAPALLAALYASASFGDRRWAFAAAVVSSAVVLPAAIGGGGFEALGTVAYLNVSWCGLAVVLGDAVRGHRAMAAAAVERAEQAEANRDEKARRLVAEERLRISRELHDSVAHKIAVVSVQAGVAEHLGEADPAAARGALAQVRAACGEALQEMNGMVGLLRTEAHSSIDPPAPGVADIHRLVAEVRAGGTRVVWREYGSDLRVPGHVGVHVYRIVQEALTNAARHGTGAVSLTTGQDTGGLTVEVCNDVRREPPAGEAGGGHGLTGMRERAALIGGTLSAGPEAGGRFAVRVAVPAGEGGRT
ncbi:sensor histidine kinase [Nocardiopsis potens]|uniref:sensor histidine kinase n=1 Tax=Nocardiopsis potens TaxID=1246458 RepID=UPI000594048A|nr:histidine kinase [Nocardiopsis potens]